MSPYYNLPLEQHATQRLLDEFNADERLWAKLDPRRRARRKTRPRLSRKQSKALDLLEFAKAKPPQDCIGKVSPGCKHCYAETFAERFRGVKGHPFEFGFDLRLVPEKLGDPIRWSTPRRIFVNSMSDLFHEQVSDEYIEKACRVMMAADWHTYQILTKRAGGEADRGSVGARHSHTVPRGQHPVLFQTVGRGTESRGRPYA